MREIHHWSTAKHENVQELMGVIMIEGRLGMISPWMEHGDLKAHIEKHPEIDRHNLVCCL
jgi:hypothetical protein